MKRLDKRIVEKLTKLLHKTQGTIRKDIGNLAKNYPSCTSNTRAQIYAQKHGKSVLRFLDGEDRTSLPNIEVVPIRVEQKAKKVGKKERIVQFIRYPSDDPFRKAHVDEVNRAYTYKCWISVFVICRKIMENLVADILRLKFPGNTKENRELYYDFGRNRVKDFEDLLRSLKSKKTEFEMEEKLVEKTIAVVQPFKKEADQKAHSWYHIVKNRAEIDRMEVQDIFDLLYALESKLVQQRNVGSKATP